MVWSISMRSCGTQGIRRNCFLYTIAETTCIPIMRVAWPKEMPFPLCCSRDDQSIACAPFPVYGPHIPAFSNPTHVPSLLGVIFPQLQGFSCLETLGGQSRTVGLLQNVDSRGSTDSGQSSRQVCLANPACKSSLELSSLGSPHSGRR